MSREDLVIVSQNGATEVINSVLKAARSRRMEWALTSMYMYIQIIGEFDEERERFVDEINVLRYDKHSLLEDNNCLRIHNEALIDNLEKTNVDFYNLSMMLNITKIVRMASVLSKMIELPILDALLILKYNREKNFSY